MRTPRVSLALLTTLFALAVGGCERPEPGTLDSPTAPQRLVGSDEVAAAGYTPIHDAASASVGALSASELIGATGGEIHLFGHSLRVPAGAVSVPTVFTLAVVPSGYVEVDLTAVVSTALGSRDVGGDGFDRPIVVTLSYARSDNVTDASRLRVLWVDANGAGGYRLHGVVKNTRVDEEKKTVTAELEHFSRYMMASP